MIAELLVFIHRNRRSVIALSALGLFIFLLALVRRL